MNTYTKRYKSNNPRTVNNYRKRNMEKDFYTCQI